MIAKELRSIMRGGSNLFPNVLFHFHTFYYRSNIYNYIATIDKKAIKRFSVGERKWIKDGHGFVEALGTLPSNFYFDDIENMTLLIMWCKKIDGIRLIHCHGDHFIWDMWGKSADRWAIQRTNETNPRWIRKRD